MIAPVEATLAEAEPEIEPNSAEEITDTLPAPPVSRPAAAAARFMKPRPASPAFSTAPKMTKIATTFTETSVSVPQMPPSAIVSVPTKLVSGMPECPNSPGRRCPNRPYTSASSATSGSGQPMARRAPSSTTSSSVMPAAIWKLPLKMPY